MNGEPSNDLARFWWWWLILGIMVGVLIGYLLAVI